MYSVSLETSSPLLASLAFRPLWNVTLKKKKCRILRGPRDFNENGQILKYFKASLQLIYKPHFKSFSPLMTLSSPPCASGVFPPSWFPLASSFSSIDGVFAGPCQAAQAAAQEDPTGHSARQNPWHGLGPRERGRQDRQADGRGLLLRGRQAGADDRSEQSRRGPEHSARVRLSGSEAAPLVAGK